jgi:hypothetical protein
MSKEYYIEFYQLGNAVKVSAADPETGIEAVVMGPLNAAKSDLQKLAVKKLEYLLAKKTPR